VLYLKRPHETARFSLLSGRALLIQRLEGSRPQGRLCTLNGSDEGRRGNEVGFIVRTERVPGSMKQGSALSKRLEEAAKVAGRAFGAS
jgi:hypothetical protein